MYRPITKQIYYSELALINFYVVHIVVFCIGIQSGARVTWHSDVFNILPVLSSDLLHSVYHVILYDMLVGKRSNSRYDARFEVIKTDFN
jgi:hypothetical protein